MSTPETNFDTAVDESSDPQSREQAIEGLEAANECDMLAEIALDEALENRFRDRALSGLGHPQCKPMLEDLVESHDLQGGRRERAEEILRETAEDAGAGP